eukprot:2731009-Prymnesium_polylepis.1
MPAINCTVQLYSGTRGCRFCPDQPDPLLASKAGGKKDLTAIALSLEARGSEITGRVVRLAHRAPCTGCGH